MTISDFINTFTAWFSPSEKLNISSSGAVAGEWTTDYNSAKELSIENSRPMIVLLGKSENERYSTDLINKVLKSEAWQEYAKAKGIPLVFLDFLNTSSISRDALRLYPRDSAGSIVKLPTLLYLNSNQELQGLCVYRDGIDCNGIKVGMNVTSFVEVLQSYTREILDLGVIGNYSRDCSDGSCSIQGYASNNETVPAENFVSNISSVRYPNINWTVPEIGRAHV